MTYHEKDLSFKEEASCQKQQRQV